VSQDFLLRGLGKNATADVSDNGGQVISSLVSFTPVVHLEIANVENLQKKIK
jgi:hypothetical protein